MRLLQPPHPQSPLLLQLALRRHLTLTHCGSALAVLPQHPQPCNQSSNLLARLAATLQYPQASELSIYLHLNLNHNANNKSSQLATLPRTLGHHCLRVHSSKMSLARTITPLHPHNITLISSRTSTFTGERQCSNNPRSTTQAHTHTHSLSLPLKRNSARERNMHMNMHRAALPGNQPRSLAQRAMQERNLAQHSTAQHGTE